jgi:hypothetical protein
MQEEASLRVVPAPQRVALPAPSLATHGAGAFSGDGGSGVSSDDEPEPPLDEEALEAELERDRMETERLVAARVL